MDFKKYSKVLVELGLIVFGILIALQIDNWNENRKNANFAKETLLEVKNSLASDSKHIEERIKRLEKIASSMQFISDHFNDDKIDALIFAEHFAFFRYSVFLNFESGSYETLKSSGLNVIKDSELRASLINFYDYEYPRAIWLLEKEFNIPNNDYYVPAFNTHVTLSERKNQRKHYQSEITNIELLVKDSKILSFVREKNNRALRSASRLNQLLSKVSKLNESIDNYLAR